MISFRALIAQMKVLKCERAREVLFLWSSRNQLFAVRLVKRAWKRGRERPLKMWNKGRSALHNMCMIQSQTIPPFIDFTKIRVFGDYCSWPKLLNFSMCEFLTRCCSFVLHTALVCIPLSALFCCPEISPFFLPFGLSLCSFIFIHFPLASASAARIVGLCPTAAAMRQRNLFESQTSKIHFCAVRISLRIFKIPTFLERTDSLSGRLSVRMAKF